MAKFLQFEKDQFAPNGKIPLHRGDDWTLKAEVVDLQPNGVKQCVDLGASPAMSAYFPAEDTEVGQIVVTPTIDSATRGKITIDVPAAQTELVALANDGTGMYVILDNTAGLTTIDTDGQPLEIIDRGSQF